MCKGLYCEMNQLSDNQFKCSVIEWYFVRPYVRIEMDSGVIKSKSKLKENLLKFGKQIMIFFIINVVNGFIQIIDIPFKLYISMFLGVLTFILFLRSIITLYNALKENKQMYERLTNKPRSEERRVEKE